MSPSSQQFIQRWLWPLRFGLILIIPLSMVHAVRLGNATGMPNLFAFWPLFVNYILLSIIDYSVGRDTSQPNADVRDIPLYKWLALAALPTQILSLIWGLHVFSHAGFSWVGQVGWILSVGAVSGTVAITAAHELIHRPGRLEQRCGGVLLALVCYGGFKIEHVYGHHVHVATPLDASSARFGQSVYAFLPQAVGRNLANAWRIAARQAQRHGLPARRNEMLGWSMLSVAFAALVWATFGAAGVLFFFAQSMVAFCELEVINYVEHYGLTRRRTASGYERVAPIHSWNSSYRMMNWFLLNLARHSDHHAAASRRYQELRHVDDAPQLPGGYGAMLLLALLPPLWFRIINPRVPQQMREPA
ncbi:alkane 1-monooxygenase [Actimicrobium sp. GrIS 1.19]|uniref:alkane 1-monooxygenase n=1 Tax=Actimicrobium sp. GrIS 1.19 TaxID=3071708 RepID=UPI002DFCA7C5|nr:alkane 1-monooxygenase [Actimicrobium sp. GrIS 1.19]